jgi:hypothetical protein
MTRRRRGRGKVRVARFLRDLQARWKSRVWDFSTERLFHSRFAGCVVSFPWFAQPRFPASLSD